MSVTRRTAAIAATAALLLGGAIAPSFASGPIPPPVPPAPGGDGAYPPLSLDDPAPAARRAAPAGLPVPDPLDFGSIAADPLEYGVPEAAEVFRVSETDPQRFAVPAPTAANGGAGTVPAGLENYYGQAVAWGSCEPFGVAQDPDDPDSMRLECGYVRVPLDYSKPAGPTIAVAISRLPATGTHLGSVVTDPGGPGGPGLEVPIYGIFGGMNENFDIIGLDPRGVGSSLPMIRCQSNDAWDRQREGSDELDADGQNAVLQYNTEQCYENSGPIFGIDSFVPYIGTVNVVKDVDVIRSVLGDPKLSYLGFSYGTSIGYEYARQFPDNIRALVLDGVVNPLENNPAELAKYSQYVVNAGADGATAQIAGFQATFEQFLDWCAENDGTTELSLDDETPTPCALIDTAAGADNSTAAMQERFRAILAKSWGGTYYVGKGRPLSFADFKQGVIMAMYTQAYWGYLNTGLLEAQATPENTDWIMRLSDAYAARGPDGTYGLDQAAFPSITCTDGGTPPGYNDDTAGIIADLKAYYDAAPFVDPRTADDPERGVVAGNDWCTYYNPQFTLPAGQTLTAMPNILVISTTYDPATPYDSGVVAAAAIGGTLLTVAGARHTSYGESECTTEITDAYMRDLVVPTDIPGETGVKTKDVHSTVITGDECMVDAQFRPVPALTDGATTAGGTATLTASGLVRNTEYVITTPFGTFTATSGVDGTVSVPVAVPAGTAAGDYSAALAPADLTQNDPTVAAEAIVTVSPAQTTAPPTEATTTPPTTGPTTGTTPPATGGTTGPQPTAGGHLPDTGADGAGLVPIALLALGLVLIGAAAVLVRRRNALR